MILKGFKSFFEVLLYTQDVVWKNIVTIEMTRPMCIIQSPRLWKGKDMEKSTKFRKGTRFKKKKIEISW